MNRDIFFDAKVVETDRRYSAANKYFEQGVSLGLTSYSQLITISSVALGFLFSIKAEVIGNNLDLQGQTEFFFNAAAILFIVTIFTSIRRNYHAGYELVHLSRRFSTKANLVWDGTGLKKHEQAKENQKKSKHKRKFYSRWARRSFFGAFFSLGYLMIIL